jgi:hypothetical protein
MSLTLQIPNLIFGWGQYIILMQVLELACVEVLQLACRTPNKMATTSELVLPVAILEISK